MEQSNQDTSKWIHQFIGPLLFIIALFIPIFGPVRARIGFGILIWMVYWWVTVAVDIKVTCLVPLIVAAFYQYMPIVDVMRAYAHKNAFLIIGASMVTAAWARWGLAKRISLRFLLMFGNKVRSQMIAWFLLCGFISFILGNTPVGAIFAPIATASLLYAGYETFEQRYRSRAASNILIAVAWGASVGGMTTPLGGGQAVVTWSFMQEYLGHEVFFIDWTARMLPISLLVMGVMVLFFRFLMKPEVDTFKGSKEFYRQELREMGSMKFEEKIVLYGFFIIVILALFRPLYAKALKGPWFAWIHPNPLFFIFAAIIFFMPAKNSKETVLSIPTLVKYFPVAILFIWPGAVALGRILTKTGASTVFAQWLGPFIRAGDIPAIFGFVLGSNMLSQFTSDTSSAGVMIPLVIEAFKNWHSLQYGAIAFIWIAGASLSWSYAIASATGAQGIVVGYGANIKRMFAWGMLAAVISIIVTTLYFILTVAVLKLNFYILPPRM